MILQVCGEKRKLSRVLRTCHASAMKRSQKTILRLCTIFGSVSHSAGSRSKTSVSPYSAYRCTSSLRSPIYKNMNGILDRCQN